MYSLVVMLRRVLLLILLANVALSAQSPRIVHVFVALADNANQGIVPVPAKLGNGDDPEHNLYWGSAFGVKTFFSRSPEWKLLSSGTQPKHEVLERCVWKYRNAEVYLVADAYRGREIQAAILNFLDAAAGLAREQISVSDGGKTTKLDIRVEQIWSPMLATTGSWISSYPEFRKGKTLRLGRRLFSRAEARFTLPRH